MNSKYSLTQSDGDRAVMNMLGNRALIEMDGLYHCTSLNALTNIFQSGAFYPSFCLEEASYLKESLRFAFAVVCFADLRRSELKQHMVNFSSQVYVRDWKSPARVTPEAQVPLTPEGNLRMTPIKS